MEHKKCFHWGLSGAITAAILYSICTLIVVLSPEHALRMWANKMHLSTADMIAPYLKVTWMSYGYGVIESAICGFIALYILMCVSCRISCWTNHDSCPQPGRPR